MSANAERGKNSLWTTQLQFVSETQNFPPTKIPLRKNKKLSCFPPTQIPLPKQETFS